ncbi:MULTISPECIES: beta-N-acetylhexosaminidase family protein [unclassified Sphingomonas]|uniref:beta-N-acetylhexosaminidase family protein n=1 Tax=unclassified Sphingomonas TaxID=196159 RepID=UPI0006F68392|nr:MULTISPECIES: beta-N-acetylglucosaminidase domain-containing protein [unclassified Sphingomonas]KQM66225.1 beta-N-acetylglucosaminidase [Sphingomonas sp. Leaf16]KQN08681.1 beta-N-acetylglucosaminidase [Sphingomonas sp. Leaf29]KQN17261.1 beta-N-acetylglucosaminidase [Sphingomonas sp. Leaf32]
MTRRSGNPAILPSLMTAASFLGIATTAAAEPVTLPALVPAPVSLEATGGAIALGRSVVVVEAPGTDPDTAALVRQILTSAGVDTIATANRVPATVDRLHIVLGVGNTGEVRAALARSGASVPDRAEGYTIASTVAGDSGIVTLAGHDADGLFHALQTFRQLAMRGTIPAMVVTDHPAMPIRGTIEGFYGKPWTMADRTSHLNFLATVKANTYVYSPKDDPYARDRWREAYPAATLNALRTLAATARRNHIDFVYAISPGPSVCFSDPADARTLEQKFDALRGIGITSFYVALDDIEYAKWNCERDKATFGPSGPQAAGVAQARFLNGVQAYLTAKLPAARPLIMVPTEYYDAKDSPYKAALRKDLDPRIVVQWTGTDVVPPAISIPDAKAATKAFGRKTLLWDNYPVNDYAQTTGRLLLAPYVRREAGLAGELTGILSNPMNQEAPSRVAVAGVAAFAWNDKGYDAEATWIASARDLAGGDERATRALLTFFDTQHMAPTFGTQPWQEQAPRLRMLFDHVRDAIANGDAAARERAIADLAERADDLANAPDIIRAGTIDPAFAAQSRPWLDAMQLWGRALQLTAAGLHAADRGSATAPRYFADAREIAGKAAAIPSIPGATRFDGPIKIADGVLDRFIADAPTLFVIRR